jgi:hypothetical protein
MAETVKDWKEFLSVFNKTRIDILAHLEGFDEDEALIKLVDKNEDGDFSQNKQLMKILCEMMLDDHPELVNATFKTLEDNFEINIEK